MQTARRAVCVIVDLRSSREVYVGSSMPAIEPCVAMSGHEPGDTVAALALASGAGQPQGRGDQIGEGYGAIAGHVRSAHRPSKSLPAARVLARQG